MKKKPYKNKSIKPDNKQVHKTSSNRESKVFKQSQILIEEQNISGPLPPPQILEKYNVIITNGGDRIMSMAEKEQSHRIDVDNKIIKIERNRNVLGQIFGFIIGVIGITSGAFLAYNGHSWVGGIIASGTVGGLVSVFVLGKRHQYEQSTST